MTTFAFTFASTVTLSDGRKVKAKLPPKTINATGKSRGDAMDHARARALQMGMGWPGITSIQQVQP